MIYRQCAAVEKEICWSSVTGDETDGNTWTVVSDAGEAFAGVERAVERLTERFETDDVLLCLSAGRNFRYDVDPSYKANRKGTRKPSCYNEVVKRACDTWPSFSHPGLEADDVLGIFSTRDANTIVCSADKDMKSLPATVWDGKDLRKISLTDANVAFFYQVLVGDTADGYPGLPSVGPKKAEAILLSALSKENHERFNGYANDALWHVVKSAYEQRGLTEADAIKQARLARILRTEDWDATAKKPILWSPPKSVKTTVTPSSEWRSSI